MPDWAKAAMAALAAAIAYCIYRMLSVDSETAANLPPDPAGRAAALRRALRASGRSGNAGEILTGQSQQETGNFKSREFPLCLSPWNRHVGSGSGGPDDDDKTYGDWNGKVCMSDGAGNWTVYASDAEALAIDPSNAREHLRCYDSLEQACRDMNGLLRLSIYADAAAALAAGDAPGYAQAISYGDGRHGFVGASGTKKAQDYTAGLMGQYRTLGLV